MHRTIEKPSALKGVAYNDDVYALVSDRLAQSDNMHMSTAERYFIVGASALNAIQGAMQVAGSPEPQSILDYGCGGGRVMRWMRAAFPNADIVASDLIRENMQFCADTFRATAWESSTDLSILEPRRSFDLIWVGSVATHLPEASSRTMIDRFSSWLKPGGLLVVTLHGDYIRERLALGVHYSLTDEGVAIVLKDAARTGYGYADYPHAKGYGISLVTPDWVEARIGELKDCRRLSYRPRGWDNHQDVLAIQKSE